MQNSHLKRTIAALSTALALTMSIVAVASCNTPQTVGGYIQGGTCLSPGKCQVDIANNLLCVDPTTSYQCYTSSEVKTMNKYSHSLCTTTGANCTVLGTFTVNVLRAYQGSLCNPEQAPGTPVGTPGPN